MRRIALAALTCAASACVAPAATDDAGADPDAWTCPPSLCPPPTPDTVDLLLVVDDSTSMAVHQARLVDQLPHLVEALMTGTQADGTHFTPPRSLHLGIVSTDMGVGGVTGLPSCGPGVGDDGILLSRSQRPAMGCASEYAGTYPRGIFDTAQGATTSHAQFATDVSCVVALGTGGCGIELPLEALLKAVAPAPDANAVSTVSWTRAGYRPPIFFGNTFGHGADPATNGGFVRPSSVLAFLTIGDEDDSSTDQFEIFSATDPRYTSVELDVRQVVFADQLYPVTRYVDGLIGLRQAPSWLVFETITGVPTELDGHTPMEVLTDPRMAPWIDPAQPNRIASVCTEPTSMQAATPGLRMVGVAEGLRMAGAQARVHSICAADLRGAIDDLVSAIAVPLTP
jgi:hypothetical protein